VKCPFLVPCALLLATGCILNPQGEDPGFEDETGASVMDSPGDLFPPGPGTPAPDSQGAVVDPVTGQPQAPDPAGGLPLSPAGPGAPPSTGAVTPAATPGPQEMPVAPVTPPPEPTPLPGAGGAGPAQAAGGAPASGGAGGGHEPTEQFDGGPFNYASPRDGGRGDAGLDAGTAFPGVTP
jgi:hypothetical protein